MPRVKDKRIGIFREAREPTCFSHSSPYNEALVEQSNLSVAPPEWIEVVGRLDEEQSGCAGGLVDE